MNFDILHISLSACTGGACPSGTSGIVKSPNFPENYPINQHLTFNLEVKAGSLIELTFTSFDVEAESSCGYDYVQVLNTDGSQIIKACGTTKPSIIKSSGTKLTVVFHSDTTEVKKGFSASWKAVDGTSSVTTGEITSPNYPSNYPDSKTAEIKITVDAGKKVELTFTDFNIEADSSCGYDNVKVFNTPVSGTAAEMAVSIFEIISKF